MRRSSVRIRPSAPRHRRPGLRNSETYPLLPRTLQRRRADQAGDREGGQMPVSQRHLPDPRLETERRQEGATGESPAGVGLAVVGAGAELAHPPVHQAEAQQRAGRKRLHGPVPEVDEVTLRIAAAVPPSHADERAQESRRQGSGIAPRESEGRAPPLGSWIAWHGRVFSKRSHNFLWLSPMQME